MRDLPHATRDILGEFKQFCRDEFAKLPKVQPLGFEEWLASTSYDENRKSQLRELHQGMRGGLPNKKQCSHIKCFVKLEPYGCNKQARIILSRSDHFKQFAGPFVKALENVLYDWDFGGVRFIKHVPVDERAAAIAALERAGLFYQETDYKAYESSFVVELMDACECELLEHCCEDYPAEMRLMCETDKGTNKLYFAMGESATCEARRMSGDMWTSLFNGIGNVMFARFVAVKQQVSIKGFVEGDDGLFATSQPLDSARFKELGLTIEMQMVKSPCEAHFCGMIFARSGEVIRDPRRFVQKFAWTGSFLTAGQKTMFELLKAKAMSALCETPQCPIVGVLAREALAHCSHVSPRFVDDGYHVVPCGPFVVKPFAPSPETRELFFEKFGVTPANQVLAEDCIRCGDFMTLAQVMPAHDDVSRYAARYVEVT